MYLHTWILFVPLIGYLNTANGFDIIDQQPLVRTQQSGVGSDKDAFIDDLIGKMTLPDLVLQMHLMFGDDIVGPNSDNGLYDYTMRFSPESPVGVIQDWYPINTSKYNELQELNLNKSRLHIPFMHIGECLHGVGSFKQSMFPQSIGLSASFHSDLVYRVGRAIGTEARSIGIHACLSPVLDLGLDPRWGRLQEAWGEDKILTSIMGVAYSSGLSKNGSWSDTDAVAPVIKHFAAHGSPQAGHNAAPFIGQGTRQMLQDLVLPFKSAIQLGYARGIMMAYNEFDGLPAAINPLLYELLHEWGFDGFVIADDLGMEELQTWHKVAETPKDAIKQWFNAGGMIQYYDYPLETFLNETVALVDEGEVSLNTLQAHVRRILSLKWDLGLFNEPFVPSTVEPLEIVASHRDLALEAAHKSIVLLRNENDTLPIDPEIQKIRKIALIGPFIDEVNYGGYSGQWGQYPIGNASTLRQAVLQHIENGKLDVTIESGWGANSWEYNAQYAIPPYLLSVNGAPGGLLATYYAYPNFTEPLAPIVETPVLDWGLYPPPGLPSNNFSAVWEGQLESPVDTDSVEGWIGLAISANSSAKIYIDNNLIVSSDYSSDGTIIPNIMSFPFIENNSTSPPAGGAAFTFTKSVTYNIRIEFQTWNNAKKTANEGSLNSQILLFWNLVGFQDDAVSKAVAAANSSDLILLSLGAAWNSDGENADRATLGLSPNQDALAQAVYALGKPVVLVLQGGRPFAIPEYYEQSAAVLNAFFPGQSGGQAIADVLFGDETPGGKMPVTVPRHVGQVPAYYNYKPSARVAKYADLDTRPFYPFGYGLSYTTFAVSAFTTAKSTFTAGAEIEFSVKVKNKGKVRGSYVAQVYLLGRVSQITQPVRQLVAFQRVYLDPREETTVLLHLEVDRYLPILNRAYKWKLEKGNYTFALLDHGGDDADTGLNVTLTSV
ncbi:glycoside hydrolase family 3 protein [Pseudomassariella vexata]|uniref:xylan 1,4-beta-xylosidase n=1 Tax=Pseudomassariella vexata TaxID=1141098 RepID=A0A1Y2EIP2_9PEZI|nr:glycoside hydrolase family 3 protein [Pseudomassariella vexata]ORY71448.1 glycoside hydrolase family 3 protein [Pseudomassariella vexata]